MENTTFSDDYEPFTHELLEWIDNQCLTPKTTKMENNEEKKDQYAGPTMGVFSPHAAAQPAADQDARQLPAEEIADNDDPESQKAIFEQKIYAELHQRAQHLMDFVYEHKLTRAQIVVALMDR